MNKELAKRIRHLVLKEEVSDIFLIDALGAYFNIAMPTRNGIESRVFRISSDGMFEKLEIESGEGGDSFHDISSYFRSRELFQIRTSLHNRFYDGAKSAREVSIAKLLEGYEDKHSDEDDHTIYAES